MRIVDEGGGSPPEGPDENNRLNGFWSDDLLQPELLLTTREQMWLEYLVEQAEKHAIDGDTVATLSCLKTIKRDFAPKPQPPKGM